MDFELLEQKFNVTLKNRDNAVFSMKAVEMIKPENMNQLLTVYSPLIKAIDNSPAAAYFCKLFSGAAMALQYMISVENKAANFSLENLTIQLYPKDGYYSFSYKVDRWSIQNGPSFNSERSDWLQQVYADFYGKTVKPLFESASKSGLIDMSLLWGQLPTYFNYYIELLTDSDVSTHKEQIIHDYEYLKYQVSPNVFGCKKNPFDVKIRMIEDLRDPNKQLRMKNVCCQFYRTGEERYCYTCPRMKEDEREARRCEARQQVTTV